MMVPLPLRLYFVKKWGKKKKKPCQCNYFRSLKLEKNVYIYFYLSHAWSSLRVPNKVEPKSNGNTIYII
jgi:hypothetical protein